MSSRRKVHPNDEAMGNDVAVGMAGVSGALKFNVYKPVLIHNLVRSLRLLADGMASVEHQIVSGIEPDRECIQELVQRSLTLVTALNPHIGYDKAAEIAKRALRDGLNLRDAAVASGHVSAAQFDTCVKVDQMTEI